MSTKIFISYSRTDMGYVQRLADHLRAKGLSPWFDRHVRPSQQWWPTIVNQIRSADSVIVIMTDALETSAWVTKEILIAQEARKPIYPLLLQGRGLPLLIDVQRFDVSDDSMPSDEFTRILLDSRGPSDDCTSPWVGIGSSGQETRRPRERAATPGSAAPAGLTDDHRTLRAGRSRTSSLRRRMIAIAVTAACVLAAGLGILNWPDNRNGATDSGNGTPEVLPALEDCSERGRLSFTRVDGTEEASPAIYVSACTETRAAGPGNKAGVRAVLRVEARPVVTGTATVSWRVELHPCGGKKAHITKPPDGSPDYLDEPVNLALGEGQSLQTNWFELPGESYGQGRVAWLEITTQNGTKWRSDDKFAMHRKCEGG